MRSIVYTSNTGTTAQYARLLSEKTALPVYSLDEAKDKIKAGEEIIYLGWLMASEIKGYKKAASKYKIAAACGVGMGATGTQIKEVRTRNKIGEAVPVFTLQGGFDINKLHGIFKMMMNLMIKSVGKKLSEKKDRTPDEEDMLDMMLHGGNRVKEENLDKILAWYHKQY